MPSKQIIQVPHPALVSMSDAITNLQSPETIQLVDDLIDTLRSAKIGLGISAPQLGVNKRVFVTEIPKLPHRADS